MIHEEVRVDEDQWIHQPVSKIDLSYDKTDLHLKFEDIENQSFFKFCVLKI